MTAVRSVERPLLDATSRWRFFITVKNAADAVSTQKGKKGLSLRLCPGANLKNGGIAEEGVQAILAEAAPCRHVTLVTDPQKPLSKAIRLMREMAMAVE